MTTRAEIVATVADMLARSDLDTQIGREVERAVEHYNRVGGFALQEARDGTFSTSDGEQWYSSVDFSAGGGSIALGAVDAKNILTIDYARVAQNTNSWPLAVLSYRDFETMSEPTTPEGVDALARRAREYVESVLRGLQARGA